MPKMEQYTQHLAERKSTNACFPSKIIQQLDERYTRKTKIIPATGI